MSLPMRIVRAAALLGSVATVTAAQPAAPVRVELPEVYELANIILAITPYGRSDRWEVQKGSPYYKEVLEHFLPFADHPVVAQVDYSRDRWREYLSFRTDAYAFRFDSTGQLARTAPFLTHGDSRPFDDHLALVQDFAERSGFRRFYDAHRGFYDRVVARYRAAYYIDESLRFLTREFGTTESTEFRVVLSPLVYRMNAQRPFDAGVTLSLATPAVELLGEQEPTLTPSERLETAHTLFTEIDHAFVNPLTARYADQLAGSFSRDRWNSTKDAYPRAMDTFNEYLTWAVYDLFAREILGTAAGESIVNWHVQNHSRGFLASALFADRLSELHARSRQPVRTLLPALLAWTKGVESRLAEPTLTAPLDSVPVVAGNGVPITLRFSESMRPTDSLWVIPVYRESGGLEERAPQLLTRATADLRWERSGRAVSFRYRPDSTDTGLLLSWWGAPPPRSVAGVMLKPQRLVLFRHVRSVGGRS